MSVPGNINSSNLYLPLHGKYEISAIFNDSDDFATLESGVFDDVIGDVANNGSADYATYDYDIDEAFSTYFWDELLPPLVVYCLTLIVGVLGNSLIIYTVARFRKMKTTTNVFLASLASADLLLLLICIPVKTAKVFSYTWTMGWLMCKSVHYLQNVSVFCSVLTLTALSLERFYAIVFPFRSQYLLTVKKAQKVIALIWGISLVLAAPILVVQVHSRVGATVEAYWCHRDWTQPYLWRMYEVYMLTLVLVVPVIVMTFAYTSLAIKLRHVAGQRESFIRATHEINKTEASPLNEKQTPLNGKQAEAHLSSNREKKQVIRMLVAVVVLFIVSWAPLLVTDVLWSYGILPLYDPNSFYKHLFNAVHLLAYFNSCLNPIVYGFLSKNFRRSFWIALCPCVREHLPPSRQISSSSTHYYINSRRGSIYVCKTNSSKSTCV